MPPVRPMLAKSAAAIPPGMQYEAKWDGFRAIVFRDGDEVEIGSRSGKPLTRYFPELVGALRGQLPPRCVLDGEIVIARDGRLDFDALLERIHPADSRVRHLAEVTPSAFVAFDLLALGDDSLMEQPLSERRQALATALGEAEPPVFTAPVTEDLDVAKDWFERFEGAGLDGVIAKSLALPYTAGKRVMTKIKHQRTADCVVGGFRWYKGGKGTLLGSMLLGLYDAEGTLHHVGVTSAFKQEVRAELAQKLAPLRDGAREDHPWRDWAAFQTEATEQRVPGATSRWNRGKDLSWEPIRIGLVCEVSFDHMQGTRFRHASHFKRWRPDKPASECRYDQLEVTPPYELRDIFTESLTPPAGP